MTPPPSGQWDGVGEADLARMWGVPTVEAHARIGSTNDRLAQLASEGASAGTVVVADEQTEGRGRRGTTWQSPPGSGLWISTLIDGHDAVPQLPLLVGLACAEGIEACVGRLGITIKWPNDLLIGGLKLGGILCESVESGVVAGIGINVAAPAGGFPESLSGIATSLGMHVDNTVVRRMLAAEVLAALRRLLCEESPFSSALPALERRDALVGHRVHTEHAGDGTACGIDASGALIVERADGSRVLVTSGSVRIVGP